MENTSSSSLAPGTVLGERYRVESELGRGGMGRVLAAFDERLGRPVAIKLLDLGGSAAPTKRQRFLREARAAAMLESEYVVRVHDAGVFEDAGAYLAMERLEGKDLQKVLRERGRFSPDEAVEILVQICRAVAAAHANGIIHRDLKPSNVFLMNDLHQTRIKVLDFGISKITNDEDAGSLTDTGSALGSPRYMSPEQVRDAKRVGPASDIWALGVVLYELLSGTTPFAADTAPGIFAQIIADAPRPLRELRADVPVALEVICARCLQKRVEDRYRDVTSLACALLSLSAPFADGEREAFGTETTLDPLDPLDPERTRPDGVGPKATSAVSRNRVVLAAIAAAAFVMLVSLVASPPARRMSPNVVAMSARPLLREASRSVASPEPEPEPEQRIAIELHPMPRTVHVASSPLAEVASKAATNGPRSPSTTTCDPPFVIDPATMTRRVKPGC